MFPTSSLRVMNCTKRLLLHLLTLIVGMTVSGAAQTFVFSERPGTPQLFTIWDGTVAAGDIDEDGDADIILSGRDQVDRKRLRATLYRNNGRAGFTPIENAAFVGLDLGACRFVDMDNDGDLDLWITGRDSKPQHVAYLYLNDGTGAFTMANNMPLDGASGEAVCFDVDNDGDVDLLMTGSNGPNSTAATILYRNDGAGGFTRDNTIGIKPLTGGSIGLIDVDADDDTDMLISGKDDRDSVYTLLYENNGAGIFTEVPNTPFVGVWFRGDIAVDDTDDDGDLDVIINGETASAAQSSTHLYLNNGSGSFTLAKDVALPIVKWGETIFNDFDGDSKQDLLISGFDDTAFTVTLLRKTGPNAYTPAATLVSNAMLPTFHTSCAIADFDGDAKPDILVTATFFDPLFFLTNQASVGVADNLTEPVKDREVTVWPNPATDAVTVNCPNARLRHVEVYNLAGTRVYSSDIIGNTTTTVISMRGYGPGIYSVVLTTEQSRIARMVVVQ